MKININIWTGRMARYTILLVLFLCLHNEAFAQWQLIGKFEYASGPVVAIRTLYHDSVVVVGLQSGGVNAVRRSTNQGLTWTALSLHLVNPTSFTFKNDSEGWLSNEIGNNGTSFVFGTTDAGLTWVASNIQGKGSSNSVFYQAASAKLILLPEAGFVSLTSTDDGVNWQDFGLTVPYGDGIAFTNDHHAVISPCKIGDGGPDSVLITDDDGLTWTESYFPFGECWQPVAVPGTNTIVMVQEKSEAVSVSTDGGYTWTSAMTDTMGTAGDAEWCDCGSAILTQETGIHFSTDLGSTWIDIGGPQSTACWTRFYYSGQYIYAGTATTDSNNGEVWRYPVHHYPTITYPGPMQTCSPLDTSFHISFTNTCFGIAASLDSVTFSGSANFQLQQLTTPLTLANEQDIGLHYAPQPGSHDTAWVHLYFNQHGDRKDTILQFVGSGPEADRVSLHLAPSATHAQPGKTFSMDVFPDASISDAGLDTISFTLRYWNDLLSLENPPTPITVQNGEASVPIIIVGNNLTLDPTQPITTLNFEAMLTDTLHTTLALTSPIANPSDPSYTSCVLSFTADSTPFSLDLVCGDSTILASWNETPPFAIQSIVPNPAQNEIRVSVNGLDVSGMGVEVFDMLGRQQDVKPLFSPNEIAVDVSNIPAGTYYLRLAASGYVQTRKVSIER